MRRSRRSGSRRRRPAARIWRSSVMSPVKSTGDLETVKVKACALILAWIRMRWGKRRRQEEVRRQGSGELRRARLEKSIGYYALEGAWPSVTKRIFARYASNAWRPARVREQSVSGYLPLKVLEMTR